MPFQSNTGWLKRWLVTPKPHRWLTSLGLGLGLLGLFNASFVSNAAPELSLGLPLQCKLQEDCWLVNYMDLDPAPNAVMDIGCGRRTYDKHKGHDFGLLNVPAMEKGVSVVASAAGTVKGVRDQVPDKMIESDSDRAKIKGIECGNGVILDHGHGWETQYCHMKQGTIKVTKGQTVTKGMVLGQVGLSGMTVFPHVHLTVRHNGKDIDPFTNQAPNGKCESKLDLSKSLWDKSLHSGLAYQPVIIQSIGLAHTPPDLLDIRYGNYPMARIKANAPQIIIWAYFLGTHPGDVIVMDITDPANQSWLKSEQTVKSYKATYLQYVGKKHKPETAWKKGTYWVKVSIKRGKSGDKPVEKTKSWAFQVT